MKHYNTNLSGINERYILAVFSGILFVLGGILGFGLGVVDEVGNTYYQDVPVRSQQARVLGVHIDENYTNPFDLVDAREITFPIVPLKGCRNWQECRSYCSNPEHFPACVAWYHSQ